MNILAKHPKLKNLLLALLAVAVYTFIFTHLDWLFVDVFGADWFASTMLGELVAYAIMTLVLLAMLYGLHKLHILHFEHKSFTKGLFVGLPVIIIATALFVMHLLGAVSGGMERLPVLEAIVGVVAILVGTGFTEEVLFRGIFQNLMYDSFGRDTRKGVLLSTVITGVSFGLWHIGNIFAEDANWSFVLGQVVIVIGMGFFFGAIYARCRNLWVTIFLHGYWDACQMCQQLLFVSDKGLLDFSVASEIDAIDIVIVAAICFLPIELFYGFFLLRKSKASDYLVISQKHTASRRAPSHAKSPTTRRK